MVESLCSVADEYRQICSTLGVRIVLELEAALTKNPTEVDLSLLYFPPLSLEALVELLVRRTEIKKINLTGLNATSSILVRIFGSLRNSCVTELIMKNVILDLSAGEALKKLCSESKNLVSVDISGSMLPEHLSFAINTCVEVNMLSAEAKVKKIVKAVGSEAPKIYRLSLESWTACNSSKFGRHLVKLKQTVPLRETIQRVIDSQVMYSDGDFSPEKALEASDFVWVRVSSLIQDVGKRESCCVGGRPLFFSVINDTRNFCAALNLVQQVDYLRRHICARSLAEVGIFVFRFFENETSMEVVVDDRIPCIKQDDVFFPAGIHHAHNSGDFWGCLVEKAFAKLHGGYKNIADIEFGSALSQLTGGVCFEADWKKLRAHFDEVSMFKILRNMVSGKKVLASLPVPPNEMISRSMEEYGISPHRSYVITGAEAFRDEKPYPLLAVQISSPTETRFVNSFRESKNIDSVLFFPRYWVRFHDYVTHFNKLCLLYWPHSDPLSNLKNVLEHPCHCTGGPDTSSSFATNPSFLLESPSKMSSEVMLVLRKTNPNFESWIQIYIHKGSSEEGDAARRYDISPNNKIFSTAKSYGSEVALLFSFGPNERLQVTLSAFPKCQCTLIVTSLDPCRLVPLLPLYECTRNGRWKKDSMEKDSLILLNKNKGSVEQIVVSISQEPVNNRTAAIGVEVVIEDVNSLDPVQRIFFSEFKTDIVVVFRFAFQLLPNETVKITPLTRNNLIDIPFSLSVFSRLPLHIHRDIC